MWIFPSYFNWSWNSPLLYNQIWPTLLSCKHLQRSVCYKVLLFFFFFFLKSGGSVKKGPVSLKRGSPQWTLSEEVGSYLSICARSSWLGTPTVGGKNIPVGRDSLPTLIQFGTLHSCVSLHPVRKHMVSFLPCLVAVVCKAVFVYIAAHT